MKTPSVEEVVEGFPAPAAALVRAVLAGANARRVPLYLVGGPVRDLLLGRPLGDADLIVEAKGEVAVVCDHTTALLVNSKSFHPEMGLPYIPSHLCAMVQKAPNGHRMSL